MVIYKITNTINNKCYIGQTRQQYVKKRWNKHKKALNTETHHNYHLQYAWKKYGEARFTFNVIHECKSREELDEMETRCIIRFRSCNQNFGYNLSFGGDSKSFHSEIRKKLSDACLGNKNGFYGRTHSEYSKQLIRDAAIGRTQSLETREKIRLFQLGNKRTLETRKNISAALLKKSKSSSSVEKMRQSLTGRKLSPEHVNKLAKTYIVNLRKPDGEIVTEIHNMKQFCRVHNLNDGNFRKLLNGKIKTCKGWTCINNEKIN